LPEAKITTFRHRNHHNPPRISIMATSSSINGQRSPEILFKVLGAGSHLLSDITSHRVPCTKLVSCHLVKQTTKIISVPSHGGHKILNYWLQDSVLTTKSDPSPPRIAFRNLKMLLSPGMRSLQQVQSTFSSQLSCRSFQICCQ
jgi:hypothetical protein